MLLYIQICSFSWQWNWPASLDINSTKEIKTTQFYKNIFIINYTTQLRTIHHSVRWGINSSSKTPPPSFLRSPPLKSANCQCPHFLGNPAFILVFRDPLLKFRFFSEPPKNKVHTNDTKTPFGVIFFILNSILSFKSYDRKNIFV